MNAEERRVNEDGKRRSVRVVVAEEVILEHLESRLEGPSVVASPVVRHRAKDPVHVRVLNQRNFPQAGIRPSGTRAYHAFLKGGWRRVAVKWWKCIEPTELPTGLNKTKWDTGLSCIPEGEIEQSCC